MYKSLITSTICSVKLSSSSDSHTDGKAASAFGGTDRKPLQLLLVQLLLVQLLLVQLLLLVLLLLLQLLQLPPKPLKNSDVTRSRGDLQGVASGAEVDGIVELISIRSGVATGNAPLSLAVVKNGMIRPSLACVLVLDAVKSSWSLAKTSKGSGEEKKINFFLVIVSQFN
jgi:hypothetical protein